MQNYRLLAAVTLLAVLTMVVDYSATSQTAQMGAVEAAISVGAPYAEIATSSDAVAGVVTSADRKVDVPILVYHIVRPSYPSDDAAIRRLALTPETFDAQMNYLETSGYTIIRFSDLEHYLNTGTSLPANPIIISFDDGWSDQFTYALPILEKYHVPATFFIFTNAVGRPGFVSWDNLHVMIAAGMTVGSHSRSHPYLNRISDDAALWGEIAGSKQILESKLGITVNEFAYPFGQYNATSVAAVQKAGYVLARGDAISRDQSTSTRRFTLSAVNAATTLARFQLIYPPHR